MTSAQKPETNHEWTVHSINIHGIFFERWCQMTVSNTAGWTLDSTNYPVEFPPPNGPMRGKESTLDIRASRSFSGFKVVGLIECKKNNPEYVNWAFFPKRAGPSGTPFIVSQIDNTPRVAPQAGWDTATSLRNLPATFIVADEARETRADYIGFKNTGIKTKTSNAAIQDAAYQVALATQAIVNEEGRVLRQLGLAASPPPVPWQRKLYFPIIVTTARLYTCDFDPSDVDPKTGEVKASNTTITERPHLVYEYALPRHLQFGPAGLAEAYAEGYVDLFTRLHVLIVQSETLPTFLTELIRDESKVAEAPPAAPGDEGA